MEERVVYESEKGLILETELWGEKAYAVYTERIDGVCFATFDDAKKYLNGEITL